MADKSGEITYANVLLWREDPFEYWEFVINCTRSKVDPKSLDDPPLSILLSTRVM